MKKLIALLVIAGIGVGIYFLVTNNKQKKLDSDYAKIAAVQQAMADISLTNVGDSLPNADHWYVFDLRVLKEKDEYFFNAVQEKLGKDFNSKLSNGDYLFAGYLPYLHRYRIYAGDPEIEQNMIYPDWNYGKLNKK